MVVDSLKAIEDRAKWRDRTRNTAGEIESVSAQLAVAAKGVTPKRGTQRLNYGSHDIQTSIISEARGIASTIVAQRGKINKLCEELEEARDASRQRTTIIVIVAVVLAGIAVARLLAVFGG